MAPALLDTASRSTRKRATYDDVLAMPEDGKDYWLVDGQIVEMGMTNRNKWHSETESRIAYVLEMWLDTRPPNSGKIHSGEVGVILDPATELLVGIDVLYQSPEQAERNAALPDSPFLVGAPVLAVEILSPSNTQAIIGKKIRTYLKYGTQVVWVADPEFRTLAVHRSGQHPVLLNESQVVEGASELPGFSAVVAKLFGR